jgi:hypothetical protein
LVRGASREKDHLEVSRARLSFISLGVVARENVFADLREKYFEIPRPDEIPAPSAADQAWCAIMEIGYPQAVVTTVAFSDGTARVLRSTGGGFCAAGIVEPVRPAAEGFVEQARLSKLALTPTTQFPQPEVGHVIFYTRSDVGISSATATEKDLSSHNHALSPLYFAGLRILHEFLQLQKKSEQRQDT